MTNQYQSYTPLVGKHEFERGAACGSGTVVCPASRVQPLLAAGPYGFREIGSTSVTRAARLYVRQLVFPTPSH